MRLVFKPTRVLLLIGALFSLAACQGQQDLVSGLSEREANEILVVLQSQNIQATKSAVPGRTVTYAITVKSTSAADALRILVGNKLPKEVSTGLADVYPPGGGGLIPTASEEKAKFLMAIQGEIENMLKVLPGVVEARVVIVLPDTDAIRDINSPPPSATASVAVVYNPIDDKGTPSVTPEDVKYLVASAVEDLAPSGVTVVMASNVPMKLIDIAKNQPMKATTKPAPAPAAPAAPPSASSPQSEAAPPAGLPGAKAGPLALQSQAQAKDAQERSHLLLWLFGTLAVIGLLLGMFGLVRAVSLRSKLARMERGLGQRASAGASEIGAGASQPPSESTPGP